MEEEAASERDLPFASARGQHGTEQARRTFFPVSLTRFIEHSFWVLVLLELRLLRDIFFMKTNFDEIETSVTKSIPYLASFDARARCFTKSLAIGSTTAAAAANSSDSSAQKHKNYLGHEHARLFLKHFNANWTWAAA